MANWTDRPIYPDVRQVDKVRQAGEQPEIIKVPVVVTNDVVVAKTVDVIVLVVVGAALGIRADKLPIMTAPRRPSGTMPSRSR